MLFLLPRGLPGWDNHVRGAMNSPELFTSLLKIMSALAVTVIIMFAVAYLFKRFVGKTVWGIKNKELINILSVKYLGAKNSIMLIDVLGNIMVIGVSGSKITLLTEIEAPDSLEQLKDVWRREDKTVSFSEQLALLKSRFFPPEKGGRP